VSHTEASHSHLLCDASGFCRAADPVHKSALVEVYKTEGMIMKRVYLGGGKLRLFGRHVDWCHVRFSSFSLPSDNT
jgi:hypothetical protein